MSGGILCTLVIRKRMQCPLLNFVVLLYALRGYPSSAKIDREDFGGAFDECHSCDCKRLSAVMRDFHTVHLRM